MCHVAARTRTISSATAISNSLAGVVLTASPGLAVGETVILLHPPLPLLGVSIGMERERQQNDSLANGYPGRFGPAESPLS